jgi:two-component system, NarL family, invasion response regulator UvrY
MPPQPGSTQRPLAGPASEPVGVLVVDDQVVFRQVAHEVIDATDDFELLGEASSGAHALIAVSELQPDLVLLDVRMPEMDGIATAARLHTEHPGAVVVLITVEDAADLPAGMSSCGAAELVRKQDFGPALLRRVWGSHGRRPPPAQS